MSNKLLFGVAVSILAAATIYLVQTAWGTKVSVYDFTLHVATEDRRQADYKLDRQLDSVWHAEQAAKLDEVLCTLKPRSRACQQLPNGGN